MKIKTALITIIAFLFFNPVYSQTLKITASQDTSGVPRPIPLIEINNSIEEMDKKIQGLDNELDYFKMKINVDSLIDKNSKFLVEEAKLFESYNPNNLSHYFLENDYRAWTAYLKKLYDANKYINDKLLEIDGDIKEIEWDYKVWYLTLKEVRNAKSIPAGTRKKIVKILNELKSIKGKYEKQKATLLKWDNEINDLILLGNKILSKIVALQYNLRDSLWVKNKPAIWNVKIKKDDYHPVTAKVKKSFQDNLRIIKNFISQFNFLWIVVYSILVTILFFYVRKKYLSLGLDRTYPGYRNLSIILEKHRFSTYVLLLLTAWITILSLIPLSLASLMATLMLLAIYFIIPEFTGKRGKLKVVMILVIYLLNQFEILMWYFGNISRYYLILESITGLVIIYFYGLNKLKKPDGNSTVFLKNIYYLSVFLAVLYGLAFLTNIFGYFNLTVLLLKVAAQTATAILIIYSLQKVLKFLVKAICEIGRQNKYSALHGYWDLIEKRVSQLIDIIAYVYGFKLVLSILEIYRPVYDKLHGFLVGNIKVGTISLSIGGILGMILIFIITYIIAKAFEIIFTNHKYVKKKLSGGVIFAISTTVKYILLLFGTVLGLAYAGIDIDKFGFFTGALGVGIGFGLQNIVNNFISGLILLYERPVEVGDTVEVGNLMGVVKKIGVRASNIRTYDGAEVIVPNGNIISNDLINWTLSDDKRRLEIKVGVAYGSDVNTVLKVLQKVVVNNENVFPEPAPKVLFEEFGESSLNFRILCWIPFDRGLSTRSEITTAIYNALNEAGINIPFPQMDIYVKEFNADGLTKKPEVNMPKAPDNSPEIISDKDSKSDDEKTEKE